MHCTGVCTFDYVVSHREIYCNWPHNTYVHVQAVCTVRTYVISMPRFGAFPQYWQMLAARMGTVSACTYIQHDNIIAPSELHNIRMCIRWAVRNHQLWRFTCSQNLTNGPRSLIHTALIYTYMYGCTNTLTSLESFSFVTLSSVCSAKEVRTSCAFRLVPEKVKLIRHWGTGTSTPSSSLQNTRT